MASIPQRSQDLNASYYENSLNNEESTIVITCIIIFAILLVYFTLKIKSCKESFQPNHTQSASTWSGLPDELDSIETRIKSRTSPENDAPASMTAIRHLSEHEYGKF